MLFDRTKTKADPNASPDLEHQVRQHRDRMAGMWAAELLGLIGHAAQDYARELAHPTAPETEASVDEDRLVRRLARDLRGKVAPHEIRDKLAHLLHEAQRQLRSDHRKH